MPARDRAGLGPESVTHRSFASRRRSRHDRTLNNAFMAPLSGGQGHAAMLGPYARRSLATRPSKQPRTEPMKTTLTVAALALAIAAPAVAQDAKPGTTPPIAPVAKPAERHKAPPSAPKEEASKPAAPATDAKATAKPGDGKDAKKVEPAKVDPKATPTAPKADASKGDAAKTTEKPAETKKQ